MHFSLIVLLYILIKNPQIFQQESESHDPDSEEDGSDDFSSAELLDEMTTNRGELKRRSLSFNDKQYQVCFFT